MKQRFLSLLLIFALAVTFSACSDPFVSPTDPVPPITEHTEPFTLPTESATVPTEPSVPEHSELYLPDVSVDDVILYFNEVCLDAEYSTSGNPSVVQKWCVPIKYMVYGNPTEEDLILLDSFAQWLNTIAGFPGISRVYDPTESNLAYHFCTEEDLLSIMGSDFVDSDGAVTFWYHTDSNDIYDAKICIRTDLSQYLRNSVILEELYNGLGPVQDTELREDSIIYSYYSEPQNLTEVDALLLKLLYHPDIKCGMDAPTCEAVIRQLYY